jgi:hypothetical protein
MRIRYPSSGETDADCSNNERLEGLAELRNKNTQGLTSREERGASIRLALVRIDPRVWI